MHSEVSASQEAAAITAALNSCLVLEFLMGIYTMVYAGTIYLYLYKDTRSTTRHLIIFVISALYLSCLGLSALQWYSLQLSVVMNGESRKSIYLSVIANGPKWSYVLLNLLFYGLFVMADGLLVWRCYHVCGQSLIILLVLLVFLFIELGLFVAEVVITSANGSERTTSKIALANKLRGALYFTSFGTTVAITGLIAYKLHRAYSNKKFSSRDWLKHLAVVLIESAAIYSLVILAYAIGNATPTSSVEESSVQNAAMYLEVVVAITGGMAPTVLVARIAITNPDGTSASTHISALRFQSPHTTDHSSRRTDEEDYPPGLYDRSYASEQIDRRKVEQDV